MAPELCRRDLLGHHPVQIVELEKPADPDQVVRAWEGLATLPQLPGLTGHVHRHAHLRNGEAAGLPQVKQVVAELWADVGPGSYPRRSPRDRSPGSGWPPGYHPTASPGIYAVPSSSGLI